MSVTFAITDTRINFVGTKLLYFPQIIAGGDYFFFWHQKGSIIWGRRLFQILLIGGHAAYILFHYSINHIKETEYRLLSIPNLVPWLILNVNSLDVGAWIVTDQFCCIRLFFSCVCYPSCQFWTWQRGDNKREDGERGWGDYSTETIILNISVKGGQLFEWGLLIEDGYFSKKYRKSALLNAVNQLGPTKKIMAFRSSKLPHWVKVPPPSQVGGTHS